jgi:2-dehydropantoate 2-reductase
LDVADWVGKHLGRSVDRGLVLFGANTPQPGRVRYYPGWIRLKRSPVAEAFANLLTGTDLRCELVDDFRRAEWAKLAINCLANPLAGLLGATNAEIAGPALDPAKAAILNEVHAVASAEGVELRLTVEKYNRYCGGATAGNIPSLWSDLARGEATEIDFINGAVVRLGRQHGVPTPVNDLVVGLIKALEKRPRPETQPSHLP